MEYKRYLLICYGWYYPNGGINDIIDSVEEEQKAIEWFDDKIATTIGTDCPSISYQIFDCDKRMLIAKWSSDH